MIKEEILEVNAEIGSVHSILNVASDPVAGITLAHGAGAGMQHEFMAEMANAWSAMGLHVLRFQFPYMEAGGFRTDRPPVALATIDAALKWMHQQYPELPVFASGKSFGGRMSSMYAAKHSFPWLRGLIYLGFPLHGAGKPSRDRAKHLPDITIPQLYLQGERDSLADIALIREVCSELDQTTLIEYQMADHSFIRPLKSGFTREQTMQQLAMDSFNWIKEVMTN